MSVAYQYYVITIVVYSAVNVMAAWSLNLQFGVGGVMNFAFIIFQAIGAYIAGVMALGQADHSVDVFYIFGWHLSWPLPLIGATIAGALLALVVGSFALRPRRRDFQATVMLVVSTIALTVVGTEQHLFNGSQGLYGVPHPFSGALGDLTATGYGWFFVGFSIAGVVAVFFFVDRITSSPWGRRLRAMRENPEAAESIGTDTRVESLKVYVIGGAIAAFSGAFLVEFIGAWSPGAWGVGETFFTFVAVIVGGLGNNFGAAFGALLVLGVFTEVVEFMPALGYTEVDAAIQAALIGVLILVFLWFRPQGIVPERRRKLSLALPEGPAVALTVEPRLRESGRPELRPETVAAATLEASDLYRDFGGVVAVDSLSLSLPPGQITGLIGPNGAGKSTALKMLAGAVRPARGRILFEGSDLAGWSQHRVARAGVIRTFQHTSEFARLTVLENLLVAAPGQPGDSFLGSMLGRRYSRPRQRELLLYARTLLDEFGLMHHADTYAGELSGGQRRLVEIMRAMMSRPKVLLLDEPMAGVNPTLRGNVEEHLLRLRENGLTMLMVEHELAAVERVCDSVLVMAEGRLIASGSMADLRRNEEVVSAYLVG
ncbi:MAG TPA: branched-chain amino acid ABC transporter ATP-binding protein/permease [Gaiellaceae bacterium]|nr:branched-chain amino acid ABC transporter ATP-binding protein/permease [Gaiellaceae bacterium]